MRAMVREGEADHLVPERVWQELARGLMEERPSRMFEVLRECGALERVLPEVDRSGAFPSADYRPEVDTGVHNMMVLDMSARLAAPLPVRFACPHARPRQGHAGGRAAQAIGHEQRSVKLLKEVCNRLRAPATAANWPTWWRASTATSIAATSSAPRP